jgi:hypothetical protein
MADFVALCKGGMVGVAPRNYITYFRELDLDGDQSVTLEEWLAVCEDRLGVWRAGGAGSGTSDEFTQALETVLLLTVGELAVRLLEQPGRRAQPADSLAPDDQRGSLADTIWSASERGSLAAVTRMLEALSKSEVMALLNAPHPTTGKHSLLYAGPNNHRTLVAYLLACGAQVTPTTRLNCQNPSMRALLRAHLRAHPQAWLPTEVPASPMTEAHMREVREAATNGASAPTS